MPKDVTSTQQGQQEPAQTSPRPCPQDCSKCSMSQQIYCTTKMLFDLSRAYQELRQQVASVEGAIADIQQQLKPTTSGNQLSIPFTEQE